MSGRSAASGRSCSGVPSGSTRGITDCENQSRSRSGTLAQSISARCAALGPWVAKLCIRTTGIEAPSASARCRISASLIARKLTWVWPVTTGTTPLAPPPNRVAIPPLRTRMATLPARRAASPFSLNAAAWGASPRRSTGGVDRGVGACCSRFAAGSKTPLPTRARRSSNVAESKAYDETDPRSSTMATHIIRARRVLEFAAPDA